MAPSAGSAHDREGPDNGVLMGISDDRGPERRAPSSTRAPTLLLCTVVAIACSPARQPLPVASLDVALTDNAHGTLPLDATCRGHNRSPGLSWSPEVPDARSALVVARSTAGALHWIAWDPPRSWEGLPGGVDPTDFPPTQGRNSWGTVGWLGPCGAQGPDSPLPAHDLIFEIWLLDARLGASPLTAPQALLDRALPHQLAAGALTLRMPAEVPDGH